MALTTPDLPPGEPPPALPNSATPQELEAHPGLARLLQDLGRILGDQGISPDLHKELLQAERSLRRARELWLPLELLWRLLEEMIREPRDLQPQVLAALQRELTWAQVRRRLPELAQLLPPPQRPPPLPALLPHLELRLRHKRRELLRFLPAPPRNSPKSPRNPPNPRRALAAAPAPKPAEKTQKAPKSPRKKPPKTGPGLGRALASERLRLRLLEEEEERLAWAYLQVLGRCLSHLRRGHALCALQAHLDVGRGRYLLAKGGAVLLKSRLEELRILMDTYPAPTIEAHRRIRAGLSERRRAAEAEAAILGAELASLRGLGPDFRQLALELGRIRQDSAQKRWALRQLRPSPP